MEFNNVCHQFWFHMGGKNAVTCQSLLHPSILHIRKDNISCDLNNFTERWRQRRQRRQRHWRRRQWDQADFQSSCRIEKCWTAFASICCKSGCSAFCHWPLCKPRPPSRRTLPAGRTSRPTSVCQKITQGKRGRGEAS